MRSIHNYVRAVKARREENGDESGFSLIELIVVVVILGVLAAVAIPIFLNIQDQAKQSSADAIAGNAATQVASQLAQNATVSTTNFKPSTVTVTPAAGYTIDNFCVTVTTAAADGAKTAFAGPGVVTATDGTRSCPA